MAMMFDICRKPTSSDTLIRVYSNECIINSNSAILLGLGSSEVPKVKFTYDDEELRLHGRYRVYITGCSADTPRAFIPKKKGKTFRIYSKALSGVLAEKLEGYGAYRICPEVSKCIDGKVYYEIFFKKYD